MITYDPLWVTLAKKKLKKQDLYGTVSSATVSRMAKDEQSISMEILNKLCRFLDCTIPDIAEYRPDVAKSPEA